MAHSQSSLRLPFPWQGEGWPEAGGRGLGNTLDRGSSHTVARYRSRISLEVGQPNRRGKGGGGTENVWYWGGGRGETFGTDRYVTTRGGGGQRLAKGVVWWLLTK
jgi:hypothetical protein